MHQREFNSIMPVVNHAWAAKVLRMQENPGDGPDLLGDSYNVELKFCCVPAAKGYIKWTAFEHQLAEYNNKTPCFWGCGTYSLRKPISEIRTKNLRLLERLVISRELFITPWDWVLLFSPHRVRGNTRFSSWEYEFRYPRFNTLPKTLKTYTVNKGKVHLTKGVPLELFDPVFIQNL